MHYFNCQLNNNVDSKQKCSHFIGYFNKLLGNFGELNPDTIGTLFKSYCCSFYGSFLWKYIAMVLHIVAHSGINVLEGYINSHILRIDIPSIN